MDCSAFRRHHLAYVDDTLPGDLLVAAARHAAECPACARHDTAVRRSLLLARNACRGGEVQCSPDFAARLEARLHAALAEDRAGGAAGRQRPAAADDWTPSWWELASTHVSGHLAGHRRTRQAVAAAALLGAVSAGAALRGERPGTAQGLGGGFVGAPFGSPAASAPALGAALGNAVFGLQASGSAGLPVVTDAPPAGNTAPGAESDAVTPVAYEGAVDAGALVAPAAMGAPVWAAAMLAGEVPAALWRSAGASSVQLIRDEH